MQRLWLCLFCITLLFCGGAQQNSGASEGGLSESRKIFIDTFWEEEQVAHYIAVVDELIDVAAEDASADTNVVGKHKTDTNNGVRVIISLTHRSDASVYHVSFSHLPYLATGLAKKFAGLVALRLGFDIPSTVMVSQNQVFHLEWNTPNDKETRDTIAAARKQIRAETVVEDILTYVFLKTINMEIREFHAPAG